MMSQALAYALGAAIALALARALNLGALLPGAGAFPSAMGLLIGPVASPAPGLRGISPNLSRPSRATRASRKAVRDLVSTHRREIVASFGVIAAGAAMNYVGVVFVPVYATTRFGLPAFEAQVGLLAASLVAAALVAPFRALSDRFGRRAVIAPALVAFAALFWLFMHRLAAEPDVANLWLLQGVGALFAAFAGPVPALMTEIFPV